MGIAVPVNNRRVNLRSSRIAIPVFLLAALSRPAAAAEPVAASVRQAIEDEQERFARAEVRRDTDGMSEMYLDRAAGRESAVRRLERFAKAGGTLVDERFETSNLEVCDDIAVESGQTVAQWDFPGRSRTADRMRYLAVWKRAPEGGWKVSRDLWMDSGVPVAPLAASAPGPLPTAAIAVPPPPADVVPIPDPRSLGSGFIRSIQDDLKGSANRLRSLADPVKLRGAATKADRDLQKVIRDVGWIDVGRFGTVAACNAAYIVSQSGDAALMRATLPLMEQDLNDASYDRSCYEGARKAYQEAGSRSVR